MRIQVMMLCSSILLWGSYSVSSDSKAIAEEVKYKLMHNPQYFIDHREESVELWVNHMTHYCPQAFWESIVKESPRNTIRALITSGFSELKKSVHTVDVPELDIHCIDDLVLATDSSVADKSGVRNLTVNEVELALSASELVKNSISLEELKELIVVHHLNILDLLQDEFFLTGRALFESSLQILHSLCGLSLELWAKNNPSRAEVELLFERQYQAITQMVSVIKTVQEQQG